jgi:basic membrane protein A
LRSVFRKAISTATVAVIIIIVVIAGAVGVYYYSQQSSGGTKPTNQFNVVVDLAGVTGDLGFNDLGVLGAQEAKQQLGVNTTYVQLPDPSQATSILQSEAASGKYNLIITIGFEWLSALNSTAPQYPNQKFVIFDAIPIVAHPNILAVYYAANESSALAGVLAAAYTKTHKIGIVLGIDTPVLYGFAIGFVYGVRWYENMTHTGPDTVQAYFTGSFTDPSKGQAAANTFISNGADVIWAAAGGTGLGAIDAVQAYNQQHPNNPIWAVGVDTDQSFLVPGQMITSVLKHVDNTIVSVIQTAKAGNFHSGVELGDLANGLVGIANLNSLNQTLAFGVAGGKFTTAQENSIYAAQSALLNSQTYQNVLNSYVSVLTSQITSGHVTIPYPQSRSDYNHWAQVYNLQTN